MYNQLRYSPLLMVATLALALAIWQQGSERDLDRLLQDCSQRSEFAIRFFYVPLDSDYFRHPRILRQVPDDDPQLGTAPLVERQGYNIYVTSTEMSAILEKLRQSRLQWMVKQQPTTLERNPLEAKVSDPWKAMEVTATCSSGSAIGKIRPQTICPHLAKIGGALHSRRAAWEWQRYRLDLGCRVSGFNPKEFPGD